MIDLICKDRSYVIYMYGSHWSKDRSLLIDSLGCCVVLCSITACYPVSKIWDGLLGSKITNRGSRPMPKQTEQRSPRRALICLVIGNAVSPLHVITITKNDRS